MTLATTVLVGRPVPAATLFHYLRDDLLLGEGLPYTHEERYGLMSYKSWGVRLPSQVIVSYVPDGPLHERYWHWLTSSTRPKGPWFLRVSFDTSYGFQTSIGAGCSDLHSWLVQETGKWLSEHGCDRWAWYHEFQGRWYSSTDPVTLLGNPTLLEEERSQR